MKTEYYGYKDETTGKVEPFSAHGFNPYVIRIEDGKVEYLNNDGTIEPCTHDVRTVLNEASWVKMSNPFAPKPFRNERGRFIKRIQHQAKEYNAAIKAGTGDEYLDQFKGSYAVKVFFASVITHL